MPDLTPLRLPAPDHRLSDRTGWTRGHWEALADHLLASAARYATPDGAQLRLPGRTSISGERSDGLEGFARTFLLAAFRIAGARGVGCDALIERYARGVRSGTDPDNPNGWPVIVHRSQQMVEAASVALALHETRQWIFDRFDPGTRDNVRRWLGGFVGKQTWPNNWVLFQVVTEEFLSSVDGPADRVEITRGLDRIEAWYRGEGWYSDGAGAHFDYYIGWAMHLYPVLWSRMMGATGGDDSGRGVVYRARLREFLDQYQYFFGSGGAPVHQGRSLTYRFATAAPLWLGALCDATSLPPGRTRRLASGVARHFVEHGAPDGHGLLTLGWYQEFLPSTQSYSGPGSPYWASKAFLGLLLPADHPVWTEPEQPAPNDLTDTTVAMRAPGFVLHSTAGDGIVRLLNHGSDRNSPPPAPAQDDPHYAKLCYSSHSGPELSERAWYENVDAHVALVDTADGTASRRRRIERLPAVADRAASAYVAEVAGARYRLATVAVAHGPWQLRVHVIIGPLGGAAGVPHTVRDGGYPLADSTGPAAATGPRWAAVTTGAGLTSAVFGLYGYTGAAVRYATGASAFGPHSGTPYLTAPGSDSDRQVLVSLVLLSGVPVDAARLAGAPEARVGAGTVTTHWPDGAPVQVRLPE